MLLGKGSYGTVNVRNGIAVKTFSKLSHIIQEYAALKYLNNCKYVVHATGVNFDSLELYMKLYDCNLREWLLKNQHENKNYNNQVMIIIHDILCGMIELHDKALVHGDIKPSNILIRLNPLSAVIGDCGFVSVYKYAKVERTAPVYRERIITNDFSHDMFSLGICLLEMLGSIKLTKQISYHDLIYMVDKHIHSDKYKNILYNLLSNDKDYRYSARHLMKMIFKKKIQNHHYVEQSLNFEPSKYKYSKLREFIKVFTKNNNIMRGKTGYLALIFYLETNHIEPHLHKQYVYAMLLILISVFGKTGFERKNIQNICGTIDSNSVLNCVKELLDSNTFLNKLFHKEHNKNNTEYSL